MPNKPEVGKRVSRPQPIEMDEIEHVRQMLEERNRDFSTFSDLPHDELMEIVGLGPGATLSKVVSRRLETAHNQDEKLGDDVEDALNDLGSLAIQSMYEPLSEADIWRLCYRMAYLVGRNISVTRETLRLMALEQKRQRRNGGKATPLKYRAAKARALWRFRSLRYKPDGTRRQLQDLSHKIDGELQLIPQAELDKNAKAKKAKVTAELPSEDQLRTGWLAPLWRKTPKQRPNSNHPTG